jgi:hypothetical protein
LLGRIPNRDAAFGNWWAPYADQPPLFPDSEQLKSAGNYAFLPRFAALAGRAVLIAGIPSNGHAPYDRWIGRPSSAPLSLPEALLSLHRAGHRAAFLKVIKPKYLTLPIPLPTDLTLDIAESLVRSALGYALVHLEGYGDVVLVQELATMEKEYRCIVINGTVVSGAGVIPSFTPLDRDSSGVWDRAVQHSAQLHKISSLSGPELSAYQLFAARATKTFTLGASLRHYVLDIAMINGRPGVVEINPLWNFGWYANSPALVLEAITKRVA